MNPNRVDASTTRPCAHHPRFGIAFLFAFVGCLVDLHAHAAEPLALPNLPVEITANLTAVAVLPGGGYVVGGSFERINGVSRKHVARFDADGSLDMGWDVGLEFGSVVNDIAIDASGSVYVAGLIYSAAGLQRSGLVKILSSGQVDPAWAPVVSGGTVSAMEPGADGWLYLGGTFTSISGQARTRLARIPLSGTGGPPDPDWTPSASGPVHALAIDAGDVVIGGEFTTVSGLGRTRLARISRSEGAVVSSGWVPSASARVSALMIGSDGDVVIGGRFTEINGQPMNYLGKVRAGDAALVASWAPAPTGEVQALAADGTGWVLVGGSFGFLGQTHQAAAARIRYDGSGDVDMQWRPDLQPGIVSALAKNVDGTVVLGGSLRHINQTTSHGAARLDGATGVLVSPVDLDQRGTVRSMALASDGAVIIVGSFHRVDGHARNMIARIRADGQLDTDWDLGLSIYNRINAMAVDEEDRLHVGGYFSLGNGVPVQNLARVSIAAPATVDASWRPSPEGEVFALAVAEDAGSLYVGGAFTAIGGTGRSRIARVGLQGTGQTDASWGPVLNGDINMIGVGPSGKVYLGGAFTSVDGQPRSRLVRVAGTAPGTLDTVWNPRSNERVYKVHERPEGVYVGGWYTSIGGAPRRDLARLLEPEGNADSWSPNPYGDVHSLHFLDDARVLVGGSFTEMAGEPIVGLAVVSLSTPATAEPLQWMGGNNFVRALLPRGSAIWLGGYFDRVGSESRFSLAAVGEPAGDPVFASGFDPAR